MYTLSPAHPRVIPTNDLMRWLLPMRMIRIPEVRSGLQTGTLNAFLREARDGRLRTYTVQQFRDELAKKYGGELLRCRRIGAPSIACMRTILAHLPDSIAMDIAKPEHTPIINTTLSNKDSSKLYHWLIAMKSCIAFIQVPGTTKSQRIRTVTAFCRECSNHLQGMTIEQFYKELNENIDNKLLLCRNIGPLSINCMRAIVAYISENNIAIEHNDIVQDTSYKFTTRQQQLLDLLQHNPEMTYKSIAGVMGLSRQRIDQIAQQLQILGVLPRYRRKLCRAPLDIATRIKEILSENPGMRNIDIAHQLQVKSYTIGRYIGQLHQRNQLPSRLTTRDKILQFYRDDPRIKQIDIARRLQVSEMTVYRATRYFRSVGMIPSTHD